MKSFNKIAEFIKTSEEKDELNRIYGELLELSKAFYGEVENKVQILLEMGVPEDLVKSIQDEIIGGAYETALAMEWNSMKTKLSDVKDINDLIKRATDEGSPFPYEIQEQLAEMKLEEREDPLQKAKPWEPPVGQITIFDIERAGDFVTVYVEVDGDVFRAIPEHHIILDEGGSEIDNKEFEDRIWSEINLHL